MRSDPKGDSSSLTTETESRERSIPATTRTNGTSGRIFVCTSDKKVSREIEREIDALLS